jgi:hypothetical protein
MVMNGGRMRRERRERERVTEYEGDRKKESKQARKRHKRNLKERKLRCLMSSKGTLPVFGASRLCWNASPCCCPVFDGLSPFCLSTPVRP